MPKLYEIKHPYYCNELNYYCTPSESPNIEVASWDEYEKDTEDEDFDLNLLFRFDWKSKEELETQTDYLLLFYMNQRKGIYRSVAVAVTKEDEPKIRKWLINRWKHLMKLWEPIS